MTETRLTVPALLQRSAREFGRETYVVTPTDRLSYEEAERRSAHAARWLLNEGVGKGSRVGLFFANGPEWVIWWLAASRIGALVVPLSTLYAPAELAKVLRLGDIGLLVAPGRVLDIDVAQRFEAALPELVTHSSNRLSLRAAPYLRRIVLTADMDRRWATQWDAVDPVVSEEILAAVEDEAPPPTRPSWCTPPDRPQIRRVWCTPTGRWCARRRHGRVRFDRSQDQDRRPESSAPCRSSGSAGCSPRRGRCMNR